jgi:NADH-quinone oxidoreductase subunit C
MPLTPQALLARLEETLGEQIAASKLALGEVTIEVRPEDWVAVATQLRDAPALAFDTLIDLSGVDYLTYKRDAREHRPEDEEGFAEVEEEDLELGTDEIAAESISEQERDVSPAAMPGNGARFAVVMHLLSVTKNQRVRVRAFCAADDFPVIASVVPVWPSANWYEREAFDLYGIVFEGHPDLRRILTDYGFIGHPFRKDFPLSGNVEMRYDPQLKRVIYQPVTIEPREVTPRIVREENYGEVGGG